MRCCWKAHAGDNIYVFYGTLDDHARGQVQPKGEFFGRLRDPWMPEILGEDGPAIASLHEDAF